AGSGNWTYGWSVIHLLDGVSTQLGVDFINSDSSSHVNQGMMLLPLTEPFEVQSTLSLNGYKHAPYRAYY
ncbi:hypothetical protein A2U01_0059368, partial [Trifolium medium]|nr:hypothetical protein [Trifolium medium]